MCRLLERLKFICIVSSNMDEFFEIRVAGLKEQLKLGSALPGNDGLLPQEAFRRDRRELAHMPSSAEQYALLNDVILPALAKPKASSFCAATTGRRNSNNGYTIISCNEVMPLLTPIGLDPSHPFPRVLNKSSELRRRAGRSPMPSDAARAPPSCRHRAHCRA